jgi:hypothetical protein
MGRIAEQEWLHMAGAYPQDDQDELSESDTSDTNPVYPKTTSAPGSPKEQPDGPQDEIMDALGDTLKRSFPELSDTPSTGGIDPQDVQRASDELEKQRRQDALQGSSQPQEPAPDQKEYGFWRTNLTLKSGFVDTPTATPDIAKPFSSTAVSTGGLFNSTAQSSTAAPKRHTLFTAETRWGGLFNQTAESSTISPPASLFDYKESPGDLFVPTAKPFSTPPSELKWPVQASGDQVQRAPNTDTVDAGPPPPQSLFDDDISSGSLFKVFEKDLAAPSIFNSLGKTPEHRAEPTAPDAPKGRYGLNSFLGRSGRFLASSPSSKPPAHRFGNSVQQFSTTNSPATCPLPPENFTWGGRAKSGNIFSHSHTLERLRKPGSNFNWGPQAIEPQGDTTSNLALPEAAPTGNVTNEPHGVSSKRQSGDMHPPDNLTNEDQAPAKRPFGQTRLPGSKHRARMDPADATTIPLPNLGAEQEMIQELADSHPVASRISSSEKFVTAAMQGLAFDETDRTLVAQGLRILYDLITSFPEVVALNTMNRHEHEMAISGIEKQILELNHTWPHGSGDPPHELESLNEHLIPLQEQKKRLQCLVETEKSELVVERDRLVEMILGSYEMISLRSGTPSDVDGKQVSKLLVQVITLEEELRKAREDHAAELEEKVNSIEQKAAIRHRTDLKERLAKCALDRETALRQLKDQYAARINDAETKSRLHKKATAQVDELQATVRDLDREKSELISAKATVETELGQVETQAKALQGYQEAYNQIVAERDQLQGEYYDVVAERDDLRQAHDALLDAPDEHNVHASVQATSMLRQVL